jgi:RNA polymerase sigma-70 factor (ECF subfamily)
MAAGRTPLPPSESLAVAQPANADWCDLIERVAGRDEIALAALYDGTAALVHGLALRILADTHVAEEVTMDVYLQVWRHAVHYDRARGAPIAWLLTLARSRAIDRRRARASHQRESEPLEVVAGARATETGPEENTAISERRRRVQSVLIGLNAEQREAIELAYFGGLSHSEIATKLGQPLGTIKTRIRLGMTRLRSSLGMLAREAL